MASSSDHPHDRENNHDHNKPNRPALKIDTSITARTPTSTAGASGGTEVPSTETSSPPQSAVSSMSTASSILSNSSREFTLQLVHTNEAGGDPDDDIVILMWPVTPVSAPAPAPSLASPVNETAPAQDQDHVQEVGDGGVQITWFNQATVEDIVTAMAESLISNVPSADCDEGNVNQMDQTLTNSEGVNDDIHQDTAVTEPCDPGYDADTSTNLDDDSDYEIVHAFWENVVRDGHDDAVEHQEGHGHSASSSVQE
ncbi:hypothetical protein AtubIFM54640_004132 [Aspergillus tubingensis]|uniref:Similar to An11g00700 n=1 Tax=Aspergillus niger TaxID=5061 RepID=A0A124BXC8_ASPNG|nr:similar to An11g00700 [Aspergillus tubingensis]GAQ42007.1 similar to An11g00700 [Aspergillus niger]GFN16613.1 similar to An11g00700 [Aspergillus tubingensis]GLA62995.1 hypothetical protein AtubIFM54640_004132 [Aspergillus tubingensis]GLA97602.1 hypothetical protein AtubIFM57143_005530 [Aspergillus tubingensis]